MYGFGADAAAPVIPVPTENPPGRPVELPHPFLVKGADGATMVKVGSTYYKASTVLLGAAALGGAIWYFTKSSKRSKK